MDRSSRSGRLCRRWKLREGRSRAWCSDSEKRQAKNEKSSQQKTSGSGTAHGNPFLQRTIESCHVIIPDPLRTRVVSRASAFYSRN